jgi:hypothetical protein
MFDWLESLLTPRSQALQDMGYLRELLNIRRCHGWWASAWEPHLEQSRQVLRAAIRRCQRRRKAVMLGSGLLLDVPLTELAAAFEEVVLVDLLHPFSTRRKLRRYANVQAMTADVSGVVEEVHRVAQLSKMTLPRVSSQLFVGDADVDLVASVNLLSQLPCMPVNYLRRLGVHSKEEINALARDVVRAHLDYLPQLPGVVTLIADFEATTLSKSGAMLKRTSTVYDVPIPWTGEEWTWRLIPLSRSPPYTSEWLTVRGVVDIKGD